MGYYTENLIKIMKEYLERNIDRIGLFQWAETTKSNIIKNHDLIDIDYLLISQFLMSLSINPNNEEAPSDSDIEEYIDKLEGKKHYNRSWYMKIPTNLTKNPLTVLKKYLNLYEKNLVMQDSFYELICSEQSKAEEASKSTISDLIYYNIINIISTLPFKKSLDFNGNAIFFDEKDFNVHETINKAYDLIKCYEGKKGFVVGMCAQNEKIVFTLIV